MTGTQPFADEERSVAIKYALAAMMAEQWGGEEQMRKRMRSGYSNRTMLRVATAHRLHELLATGRRLHHPTWSAFFEHATVQARLVELALDSLTSERLGPEIVLTPAPIVIADTQPVHALVFSAFPHYAHELYPLMVDAVSAEDASCQAIGAHESWVVDGALQRALIFDINSGRLVEGHLSHPLVPGSAQALALDLTAEAESHRHLERQLAGIPLMNPSIGAQKLDDKQLTSAIWQQAKLATPDFICLPAGVTFEAAREALAPFTGRHGDSVVIKPTGGTEGRGVEFIDFSTRVARARSMILLVRLAQSSPMMIMEARGSVRVAQPSGAVRCTVRIDVCWDGERAWAESGYAQVAATPDGIASAGRGGRVIALRQAWSHLVTEEGRPLAPTPASWRRLLETAECGAAALARVLGASMPALLGIDLLLDHDQSGEIIPVLLEANPRPAGMSHARFVTADGPTDEPGVSRRLWRVIAQRRVRKPASANDR